MNGNSKKTVKGIKIRTMNICMILISFILYIMLILATINASYRYNLMTSAMEDYIACEKNADLVKEGSDYLTEQVRLYTVTMDKKYVEEYFREVYTVKRRDSALEEMKALHLGEKAGEYLQSALDNSNKLMEEEIYAMKLISVAQESDMSLFPDVVKNVEIKEEDKNLSYDEMIESKKYSKEELDRALFEHTKQSNLCEYGKDIIRNTERMSLNKNILNKKYYIIVPYYASELGLSNLDKEETKSLVFSELYTRAQAIVASIAACGVRAKILKSDEIIDLLYMSYNRDEAEVFGFDKAIMANYNEMYSTAPEVLDKKMQELDKIIEEKAVEKAREKLNEAMSEKRQEVQEKEDNIEYLIDELAKLLLDENEEYIEKDVIKNAKQKIDNAKAINEAKEKIKTKEGGSDNEERPKKKRGRKPKTTTE